eukprot:UN27215
MLQDFGYDSVIYNGPTGDEFVVYNPDQISSIQLIQVNEKILSDFKKRRLNPLLSKWKRTPFVDKSIPLERFLNSIGLTHTTLDKITAPLQIHTTSNPTCVCFLTFLHQSRIISVPLTPGEELIPNIRLYLEENGLEAKSWEVIHIFDWNCFCEVKSWNFLSFLLIIEPNLFSKNARGEDRR